jgi:rhodanese-related sulfurtransferase
MKISKSVEALVNEALAEVTTLSTSEVQAKRNISGVMLIDLRDIREVQREGRIPGSLHIPRGMLEFWVDPESPYYKPAFDGATEVVLYCNKGWRSALAAKSLQSMGMSPVSHLNGGMTQWVSDGGEIEPLPPKPQK